MRSQTGGKFLVEQSEMCFTVKERVGDQYLGCKRTPQSAEQMPRTSMQKDSRCMSKLLGGCEVFASALIRRLVRGWQSIASSQQTVSNIQFYFTRNTCCKNNVTTQHFQHTVTTFLLSSLIGSGDFWRIRGHARSVFNRIMTHFQDFASRSRTSRCARGHGTRLERSRFSQVSVSMFAPMSAMKLDHRLTKSSCGEMRPSTK